MKRVMKYTALITLILFSWLFTTCQDRSKPKYETLSLPEFQRILTDDAIQVLDTRSHAEYRTGHIEKAINMDIYNTNFDEMTQLLDTDKPVAIYCRKCNRSKAAAEKLTNKGFKKVYILGDGIQEWKQGGNPLSVY